MQWQVLEASGGERGLGQRLVVHGFSSVRRLAVAEQRRLGELGVVAMNAFSYIPQEIGRRLLQEAAALHGARDPERGYPTGFAADGAPRYPDAAGRGDANVFFGPLLDQLRDLQVELIAASVYQILDHLGYARLGRCGWHRGLRTLFGGRLQQDGQTCKWTRNEGSSNGLGGNRRQLVVQGTRCKILRRYRCCGWHSTVA